MNAVFLLALLFQNPALNSSAEVQRREAQLRQVASMANRQTPSVGEENSKAHATARDEELVGKFNKLINTLMDFADAYKEGKAIDVKRAQAVRKAWLDLEKSEAVFQDDKKK